MLRTLPLSASAAGDATEEELLAPPPAFSVDEVRPMEALLTRRMPPEVDFRSGRPSWPVVKLVELRSFFELDLLRFPVEAEAAVCSLDSESRFLTRVVSESRLALGCGELLTIAVGDGFVTTGDPPAFDETGIDELRLFSSEVSLRLQLCADSGLLILASLGALLVIELGPVDDLMYKLPVLLFNDLFDNDPDGDGELFSVDLFATKFRPVGGFGAT